MQHIEPNRESLEWNRVRWFIVGVAMCMCIVLTLLQADSVAKSSVWMSFLRQAGCVLVFYGFVRWINPKENAGIDFAAVFMLAFVLRMNVALRLTYISPWNDFQRTFSAAQKLVEGDISGIASRTYSECFPFIQPYIVYLSKVMQVVGTNPMAMRVVDGVITSLVCGVICMLGRQWNKRGGTRWHPLCSISV